jgi:two-component system chemotaxis sensor kinase CheA
MFVIVAQVGAYRFGLVVDRVHDTEEIVVKPVAPILRNVGIYSGNTILGDGSVIMILDPNGIAAATGEITIADQGAASGSATSDGMAGDRIALLVFRAGTAEAKAVPLALIARLEEFDAATIETSNGGPVVQYRGKLMPLVPVDPSFTAKTTGRQPVIVFGDGDSTVGLLVDEIVDIVEDNLDIQLGSSRDGLLGSAIVSGKTTEIIDAAAYFTRIRSDWFTARKPDGQQGRGKKRLLFLDDSTFFRNLLSPILTAAGYAVTSVSNANDALEMRSRGETFDVIISDIEMPGMDGFEFARAVRAEGPWKDIPLIALSSRATPSDFARGREAGFVDYVAKLDRAALLESLAHSHELAKGAAA